MWDTGKWAVDFVFQTVVYYCQQLEIFVNSMEKRYGKIFLTVDKIFPTVDTSKLQFGKRNQQPISQY